MIRKIILLACGLLCCASSVFAQDSLVFLQEVTFKNQQESDAFREALLTDKVDYFTLFSLSGTNPSVNSKQKFYDFLSHMGYEKWAEKNSDKKVKFVYETIHKTFLEKYEAKTLFSDIWSTGDYNCVSATALYCMAFDHFNIPYTIKEKPQHVYPVAFPKERQVIVETTNPMVGSFAFNQQFKLAYIENLRKQKAVSSQEVSTTDLNKLFDKYFFKGESDISFRQLVGIQYMNDGIFKHESEEWLLSVEQLEKAYLLYKNEQVANGLLVSYAKAFQMRTKKDTIHAQLLAKLSRFSKYGITQDMIKSEFGVVTNSLLFDQGKSAELATYYSVLDKGILDKELKSEIGFLYFYEQGRYYYNLGRYSESEPYFEKAFVLHPNNQEVQSIYLTLVERNLRASHNAQEAITQLKEAADKNPTLKSNNNFNTMVAKAYLIKFGEDFENNKPLEGDKSRLLFEEIFATNKDLNVDNYLIGQAYSIAAVYYFRKNQTAKAKTYINKGLELAPDNRELLTRKRAIN